MLLYRSLPFCLAPILCGQTYVTTANYGNERTNATLTETILNSANVNPVQFGKLGACSVDGQIFAQPLYVPGEDIAGKGVYNVVYAATMHNSVYAFDADGSCAGAPLWHVQLGPAVSSDVLHFRDITPEIGILSTPASDVYSNTIYVVAETYERGAVVFRLHALDLSDGSEKLGGPVVIQAAASGIGDASQNGMIALDPLQQLQRPGLLLANNSIYIAFGSIRDRFPYHGWILAYDAGTLLQTAVFNATPNGGNGGIWQSGRGLGADEDGNIYTVTGNGDFDGIDNFGEAFVKLSPTLEVLDWFAPADWRQKSDRDDDLGSMGPVLVPGTNMVIGGDKQGQLYVVNRQNMGHLSIAGASVPQMFQPLSFGGLFNMALWPRDSGSIAYLVEEADWTGAFRVVDGAMEETPFSQTPVTSAWDFQGMTISANGSDSGILWMTSGDPAQNGTPGILLAFDALDLTNLLWTSDTFPDRDALGGFAKFANPTVANGRVYVPTFSNVLVVYGLLPQDDGVMAPAVRLSGHSVR